MKQLKSLNQQKTLLENNATQEEVDKKAKEISSYVSIFKIYQNRSKRQ